jgi:hypothetical protein
MFLNIKKLLFKYPKSYKVALTLLVGLFIAGFVSVLLPSQKLFAAAQTCPPPNFFEVSGHCQHFDSTSLKLPSGWKFSFSYANNNQNIDLNISAPNSKGQSVPIAYNPLVFQEAGTYGSSLYPYSYYSINCISGSLCQKYIMTPLNQEAANGISYDDVIIFGNAGTTPVALTEQAGSINNLISIPVKGGTPSVNPGQNLTWYNSHGNPESQTDLGNNLIFVSPQEIYDKSTHTYYKTDGHNGQYEPAGQTVMQNGDALFWPAEDDSNASKPVSIDPTKIVNKNCVGGIAVETNTNASYADVFAVPAVPIGGICDFGTQSSSAALVVADYPATFYPQNPNSPNATLADANYLLKVPFSNMHMEYAMYNWENDKTLTYVATLGNTLSLTLDKLTGTQRTDDLAQAQGSGFNLTGNKANWQVFSSGTCSGANIPVYSFVLIYVDSNKNLTSTSVGSTSSEGYFFYPNGNGSTSNTYLVDGNSAGYPGGNGNAAAGGLGCLFPVSDGYNAPANNPIDSKVGSNPAGFGYTYVANIQNSTSTKAYTAPPPTGSGTGPQTASCESSGFSLSWIACPVINAIAGAESWLGGIVDQMLKTPPVQLNSTSIDFQVWSNFRIFGNIVLVIALLILVYAETIGGGVTEAYALNRVLPRILIAAILLNLSIYIIAALEDITNVIGAGIYALVADIFRHAGQGAWTLQLNGFAGDITGFTALLAIPTLWIAGGSAISFLLLFVGLPALFAVIGVVVTLILRQGILALLTMTAPVAFALYSLPNTQQYFKRWWDLLIKTLMVYPIVALVFVMADVTSVIVSKLPITPQWLAQLMGVVALISPLFLIPFAFKIAGGVTGSIYGAMNNFGHKATEAIKGNQNNPHSLRNNIKRGLGKRFDRRLQSAIDKGYNTKDANGNLKQNFGSKYRRGVSRGLGLVSGNLNGRMARYNKEEAETAEYESATGRDNYRYAAAGYIVRKGVSDAYGQTDYTRDRAFNSKGAEISFPEYRKGKSLHGGGMNAIGTGLEYSFRKAQSTEDIANARYAFAQNAAQEGWTNPEMRDVWAQSTYPHKDKWLSEWFSTPTATDGRSARGGVTFEDVSTNVGSLDKAVNEQHRTKEGFRAASLRKQDWEAQSNEMNRIQDKISSGYKPSNDTEKAEFDKEKSRLAKIYENIDVMATKQSFGGTYTPAGQEGMAEGQTVVSGASAEVQGVIKAMHDNRRFGLSAKQDKDTGYSSTDQRVFTDKNTGDVIADANLISDDVRIPRVVVPPRPSSRFR